MEKEQENKLEKQVKEHIEALKANTNSLINKLEEAQNNLQKNEEKEWLRSFFFIAIKRVYIIVIRKEEIYGQKLFKIT